MSGFWALTGRDVRLSLRAGGGAGVVLGFFAAVASLVPLGVGPDLALLSRIAGGVLGVAAVLAALLALDRLFQADFDDGSLDLIALSPVPLEAVALAKMIAHWLTTGLPLTLMAAPLGLAYGLARPQIATLMMALLLGTPAISAIGGIGAALTLPARRGGLVLPFVVLPLLAPVVIFTAAAVNGAAMAALAFLAAFALLAAALSPFAAAAALRLHLGQ
jgi:heme exporter protein B